MPVTADTRPAHTNVGLYVPEVSQPVVAIAGEDRNTFLQGIMSQDIVKQEAGSLIYTFFLNPKARILFDAWVAVTPEEILVFPPPGTGEAFVAHLRKYLFFRTKATIQDRSGQYREICLVGPETVTTLLPFLEASESPHPFRKVKGGGLALLHPPVFQLDLSVGPSADLFVPAERFDDVLARLKEKVRSAGGIELDSGSHEAYLLEKGIPSYPSELNENHFPAEAGLDNVGVSFNKGCYVGQEPVTRLRFQGHLNRRLSGFVISGADYSGPVPQAVLSPEDGSEVGTLTRYAFSPAVGRTIGIGYLKKTHWDLDPDRELVLSDGQRLKVSSLPFL